MNYKNIIIVVILVYLIYYFFNIHINNKLFENMSNMLPKDLINKEIYIKVDINGTNHYLNYKKTSDVCDEKGVTCGLYTAVISPDKTPLKVVKFNDKNKNSIMYGITTKINNKSHSISNSKNIKGLVCWSPLMFDDNIINNSLGLFFLSTEGKYVITFNHKPDTKPYYLSVCQHLCQGYYKLCITNNLENAIKFDIVS